MNFLKTAYRFLKDRICIIILTFMILLCGMFGPEWTIDTFYDLIKKQKGE